MSALTDHLDRIFEAERRASEAEAALLAEGRDDELSELLQRATGEALALGDEAEAARRLRRLADLCAQVPGPASVDALLAILDHGDPAVRTEAGEALLDVAYERFKEVARGVERALDRKHSGLAMEELPFILTEIRDPDPLPLVVRFLAHPTGQVVAAAIEALAAFGDPRAIKPIEKLVDDTREATLEDLEDGTIAIGDLARDALEELGGGGNDPDET